MALTLRGFLLCSNQVQNHVPIQNHSDPPVYLNLHFLVTTAHSHAHASHLELCRLTLGQTFQWHCQAARRLQLVGDPIDANEAQRPCPQTWVGTEAELTQNGFTHT